MTTAQAARSATPSVVSAAAVAVLKVVRREVAHREVRLQEIQAEVAVAPAAMTMIIMLRAAVAVEVAGDSFLWDSLREEIYQKSQ